MSARRRAAAAAAAWLLASAGGARAHDTWVLPRSFRLAPGAHVLLEVTSGMAFPKLESPIDAARVEAARLRLAGRVVELAERHKGPASLQLGGVAEGEGTATAWVALRPRTLELSEAQVEEYLKEIGLAEKLLPEWRHRPEPRRWRESYRKLAKTVFRVGAKRDDSWAVPVGLPLELVPEDDPTALSAGDRLSVRVLRDGRPLAGFVVAADPGRGRPRRFASTDAEGRAAFELDAAGPWLLTGTDLRPAGADWQSDFATLTVEAASP